MDNYVILEFQTYAEAQLCLNAIHGIMADVMTAQGYTVLDTENGKQFVGKNAATGEDSLTEARTISWDFIRESPVTTFYFSSPRGDVRLGENGMDLLADFIFTEKSFPDEWLVEE